MVGFSELSLTAQRYLVPCGYFSDLVLLRMPSRNWIKQLQFLDSDDVHQRSTAYNHNCRMWINQARMSSIVSYFHIICHLTTRGKETFISQTLGGSFPERRSSRIMRLFIEASISVTSTSGPSMQWACQDAFLVPKEQKKKKGVWDLWYEWNHDLI